MEKCISLQTLSIRKLGWLCKYWSRLQDKEYYHTITILSVYASNNITSIYTKEILSEIKGETYLYFLTFLSQWLTAQIDEKSGKK